MKTRILAAILMVMSLPGFARGQALWNGLAPSNASTAPLAIRVADGDLSSVLGTFQYKAQSFLLTANATNFVYLDLAQTPPVIVINTSGFPSTAIYKIATVVTNATRILTLTDSRPPFNQSFGGSTSGGGTTIVASNPGTCTQGQTFYNTATNVFLVCVATNTLLASPSAAGGDLSGTYPNPTVSKVNGGLLPISAPFTATDSNGRIIATGAPSNPTLSQSAIYMSPSCPIPNSGTCYNVTADTHSFLDATFTSGSPTFTTAGEVAFTCPGAVFPCSSGGDVGKVAFGFVKCGTALIGSTTAGLGGAALSTIITVNSPTSATLSSNATQSTTGATGCVAYGTPDDTGTALAEAGAIAASSCPSVIAPALNLMWTVPHFFTNPAVCQRTPEDLGLSVLAGWGFNFGGGGKGTTHIYIPPWFNMANCTHGTGNSCFGGAMTGSYWHDFSFTGLGNSRLGTTSNKRLFEVGGYVQLDRVGFINFGASDGNLPGLYQNSGALTLGGATTLTDVTIDGWGSSSFAFGPNGGGLYALRSSFQDSNALNGSSINMNSGGGGGIYYASLGGNEYFGNGSTPVGGIFIYANQQNTTIQLSNNDLCLPNGATNFFTCLWLQGLTANTVAHVSSVFFNPNGTGGGAGIFINTNGGTVYLCNNRIYGAGAGMAIQSNTGTIVYDQCANELSTTGVTPVLLGTLYGSASITGTTLATGNVALTSGWDTSTKGTFSGDSRRGQFTITAAGTPTVSPVVTVTFPATGPQGAFWKAPNCSASIVGGTGLNLPTIITNGAISATSYAFTFTGATPAAGNTYVVQYTCSN